MPQTGVVDASADLYLYDQAGALIKRSDGQNACGPCTVALGSSQRNVSLRMNDLIAGPGGGGGGSSAKRVTIGYSIVVVNGDDGNVVITAQTTVNAGTKLQISVFGSEPKEIAAPAP